MGFQTLSLGFLLLEFRRVELALCLSGKGSTFSKRFSSCIPLALEELLGVISMGWAEFRPWGCLCGIFLGCAHTGGR